MSAEIHVGGNTPRLLERGEAPPPSNLDPDQLPDQLPVRYWTADKAEHVVAQVCRAASKFYGPSVKAAEWELELVGEPMAAVMNDWVPLKVGASGDKTANLIALGVVLAIIVALRVPDILEVHGILKPWKSPEDKQRELEARAAGQQQQAAPAGNPAPPPGTVIRPQQTQVEQAFEPTLVGANGDGASDGGRMPKDFFEQSLVGGGGFAKMNPE
jgi:hypothetical protein